MNILFLFKTNQMIWCSDYGFKVVSTDGSKGTDEKTKSELPRQVVFCRFGAILSSSHGPLLTGPFSRTHSQDARASLYHIRYYVVFLLFQRKWSME